MPSVKLQCQKSLQWRKDIKFIQGVSELSNGHICVHWRIWMQQRSCSQFQFFSRILIVKMFFARWSKIFATFIFLSTHIHDQSEGSWSGQTRPLESVCLIFRVNACVSEPVKREVDVESRSTSSHTHWRCCCSCLWWIEWHRLLSFWQQTIP